MGLQERCRGLASLLRRAGAAMDKRAGRAPHSGEARGYPQNSASITAPVSPAQSPLKLSASE